jgi:hypothetical protein
MMKPPTLLFFVRWYLASQFLLWAARLVGKDLSREAWIGFEIIRAALEADPRHQWAIRHRELKRK